MSRNKISTDPTGERDEQGMRDKPEVTSETASTLDGFKVGADQISNGNLASDDDFDLAALRRSQDFTEVTVKRAITTVPVRRPDKQDFVRVKPGEENRLEVEVIELKDEREMYFVAKSMRADVAGLMTPKSLVTTLNRQGVISLWPIGLPGGDGRLNPWHASAYEAAKWAESKWVRVVPIMSLGGYEVMYAADPLPEPDWPDVTFQQLLKIAFRDRYIRDFDHPVIKRLLGRA